MFPIIINVSKLYEIKSDEIISGNNFLNPFVKDWMNDKSTKLRFVILFVLLSGSLYHSLLFSDCQLFGYNLFLCPLTFNDYNNN